MSMREWNNLIDFCTPRSLNRKASNVNLTKPAVRHLIANPLQCFNDATFPFSLKIPQLPMNHVQTSKSAFRGWIEGKLLHGHQCWYIINGLNYKRYAGVSSKSQKKKKKNRTRVYFDTWFWYNFVSNYGYYNWKKLVKNKAWKAFCKNISKEKFVNWVKNLVPSFF